ncbi:hypothetical protein PIROE2DRAFT_3297, partial [Piromyces sp. E2]
IIKFSKNSRNYSKPLYNDVVNILDSYIDLVSEELTPFDLGPHKINLVPDTKSVKKEWKLAPV